MNGMHALHECESEETLTRLSLAVRPGRLISVSMSAGDTLQVERGVVWYTIEGRTDDVFVDAGESRTLAENLTLSVTGFGDTVVSLISTHPRPRFVRRGGVRPYVQVPLVRRALEAGRRALRGGLRSGLDALAHRTPSAAA